MNKLRILLVLICFVTGSTSLAIAHGPDLPPHQIANLGELVLENGGVIKNLRMSYVTHGQLNTEKDNAVLFMHGFAGNHHNWDFLIGSGKPLDTDRYFIITSDSLGCTQLGYEHSTSATNSGLKMQFPAYNVRDMVNAEYKLITDALGIDHLLAVTGLSMGAMKTLQFAVSYPQFMDGIILTVGGAVWTTQSMYCNKAFQSIIENCAGWDDGNYQVNPVDGAASALWTHVPMMYSREWWNENITSIEAFQGWWDFLDKIYMRIQDARDLYLLSKALQRSNIADTPGFDGDLMAALKSVKAKTLFITSPYDQWYLPEQIEIQHKTIPDSRLVSINATVGHMICCGVDPQATWTMGEAIRGFLREVTQGTR